MGQRFPRSGEACITAAALGRLALTLEKLDKWHTKIGGDPNHRPCLHDIDVSPTGRLTAHITLDHDGHMVYEYVHDRWELKT